MNLKIPATVFFKSVYSFVKVFLLKIFITYFFKIFFKNHIFN